ncbi:MAG: hypothetical protein Kow0037_25450 [Calditrichia bacterium]
MNSWKILVLDDQPEIRASLENQLTLEGYDVKTAASCAEAEFVFTRNSFDIAILDVMLPDGNGIDVYRKLKATNPDIYTIMITGNATLENTITALNEGVNAYLLKPFPKEQLTASLLQAEKTLKLKAENQALFDRIVANRQMYENLLNSSSEAILVIDLDFKIHFCNRAATKVLRQPEDQLMNHPLYDFLEDGYKVLTHIHQQLAMGRPVAAYRVGIKTESRKNMDAHLTADFLHNQMGHIEGLIINLSNVMIYDELFNRIMRKEKLETIINLSNAIGHEIRNPINILSGRLQLLAEEIDSPEFKKAYSSINRQVDRLVDITKLLSKFNFRREDTIPEQLELVPLIEEQLEKFKPRFKEKKIKISSRFERRSAKVEGNASQFNDALSYLFEALYEYMPEHREIKIRGNYNSEFSMNPYLDVHLLIPDLALSTEQIYAPYQSDKLSANSLVGLGLTIMHMIFSNFNVKIEAHIQNQTNTLIRLKFPLIAVEHQAADKILSEKKGQKNKGGSPS